MPPERSNDAALFDMLQAAEGVLRHTVGKTRDDIVWRIVTDHIPPLIQQLKPLIPPSGE